MLRIAQFSTVGRTSTRSARSTYYHKSDGRCDPGGRRKHAGCEMQKGGTRRGCPRIRFWAKERSMEHLPGSKAVSLIRVLSRVGRALQPLLWAPPTGGAAAIHG